MKKLMLTTAIVAVTSLGAVAQTAPAADTTAPATTAPAQGQAAATTQNNVPAFLASDFIGMDLYTLDSESVRTLDGQADAGANPYETRSMRWTSSDMFTAERDAWENIGNIDDVVMGQDGEIRGVLVDVGGFLGLFARTVMVDIDDLYFVADDAAGGTMATDGTATTTDGTAATTDGAVGNDLSDFFVVASMSRESLEALPEWNEDVLSTGFEQRAYAPAGQTQGTAPAEGQAEMMEPGNTDTTMDTAPGAAQPATGTQPAMGTDYAAEGYTELAVEERTAETLTGANVYDGAEDNIGNVQDLVLDGDSAVTHLLVDVGGFLGMGSHTIALPVEEANILWHDGNDDVRVHVNMTREQLEAMPAHEG